MVTNQTHTAKDDPKNARLSEHLLAAEQDDATTLRMREIAVDFDDDPYANVPCTD